MASFPRIVRAWQRVSPISRPALAAAQPSSEPEPKILPLAPTTQTLQPSEPKPPPSSPLREPTRISSPAKKAASPAASPKYEATVASLPVKPAGSPPVKPARSPPVKPARSPPVSPSRKSSDPRHSISPNTYNKPLEPTTPPLPPLALPKSADVTTIKSRIQPKVEQKTGPYKKSVEEPNRQAEYGSEKPPQKQLEEDINLTGRNVGTVMEISQFSGDRSGGGVTRKMETETGVRPENDEGITGATEKIQRATGFSMTPFMNSNFQEVNNSIMYDSSCTVRDPGLHLDFSGEKKDDRSIDDGGEEYKS